MKIFFTLLMMSSLNTSIAEVDRAQSLLCLLKYGKKIAKDVSSLPKIDKFKHCAATCQLSIKCGLRTAIRAGYLKEFWDLLGNGNPEINDICANKVGARLFDTKMATTLNECLLECDKVDWSGDYCLE